MENYEGFVGIASGEGYVGIAGGEGPVGIVSDYDWPVPTPSVSHVVLKPDDLKPRVLIVGDIHGCLDEFRELLIKANYNADDCTLILVGDVLNKGPRSLELLRYVRSLGAYCVRGNHDDTTVSHALRLSTKPRKASYDFVDQLTSEDIMWLKELPYTISVPSMAILVVHAGIVPGVPLHLQLREDMVTMRNLDSLLDGMSTHSTHSAKSTRSNSDTWSATASPKVGRSWAEVYCDGNYMTTEDGRPIHIYFGHDAKRGLQRLPYATGLDTGCCYGRQLSAIMLPANEVIQVDAKSVYVTPGSD